MRHFFLILLLSITAADLIAQSDLPVRTRWISPDNSLPLSYEQWKSHWNNTPKLWGGQVVYRYRDNSFILPDSFVFGNDYAYFKDYVRHSDGTLCQHLPPINSFVVWLNGNDNILLTDDAPRWSFGDPNISGMGWFGIELGNFDQPAVAIGDTFSIQFTCYPPNESPEQATYDKTVLSFNFVAWPTTLQLQPYTLPEPPDNIQLERLSGAIKICWKLEEEVSYKIYRRNQSDTLALNFPRFQYEKIAENIIDSCYVDNNIDTNDTYGYILFAKNLSNGLISGRSRDARELPLLKNVRAIFVQPELYVAIKTNLMRVVTDWENEGADVIVYAMQFPTVEALRDTLRSIDGLTGTLLIGNFPVPWFQFEDDSGTGYQEYPVDLYYMDLDGVWEDNLYKPSTGPMQPGSDGIFDTHYANYPRSTEQPDIVVGRITPTPGMGGADEVVNYYLNKCCEYRHDLNWIRQQFTALAYPDDDWHTWGQEVADQYISQAYQSYHCISDINATTGIDYRDRLDEHYSLIHVWVHSWSQGHAFRINNGTQNQYFYNNQILPAGANANFYLLFACGNSRYVEDQNCAAIYAFSSFSGINTIGSTHSGGMLHFDYFYPALAQGISFGEAFLQTFQFVGNFGFNREMRGWYYGLTFNGDPFIVPQAPATTVITKNEPPILLENFDIANYPNPFNSTTRISFQLKRAGEVKLNIYNNLGELIFTRTDYQVSAGSYFIKWNGKNSDNEPVSSGVYFYQIIHNQQPSMVHKMALIK